MNLIFTLLSTRQFLSKEQIRQSIADYRDSTQAAFERKFERDKEELRELGITVEMGSNDKFFEDEPGYRIPRDQAELPELDLTREEAAVVGLAAQVWEHSSLAGESTTALVKLKTAGVQVDPEGLRMAEPRIATTEPAFESMWEATTRRVPVTFTYEAPGRDAMLRHLQPWRMISWRGRWYVGGHDLDRGATRVFRLSRITDDVVHDGRPGSYEIPADADVASLARSLFPAEPDRSAVLLLRTGRAQSLRRTATTVVPEGDGFDRVEVPYSSTRDFASEIASYGPDVVAVEPAELRDLVVQRLEAALVPLHRGTTGQDPAATAEGAAS